MTTDLVGFYPTLVRKGIFKGIDLNALAAHFWALPTMSASGPLPAIRWRAATCGSHISGRAWTDGSRMVLTLAPQATFETAAEVLLHELVHCAMPPEEHHGERFCRTLIACAREAFDLELDVVELLQLPAKNGKRAYAIDAAITVALTAKTIRAHVTSLLATETHVEETAAQ